MMRAGLLVILLGVIILGLFSLRQMISPNRTELPVSESPMVLNEFVPGSGKGQLIHHRHFSLSYVEDYEQAEWVAYELTRDELDAPRVPRQEWFNPDYNVTTRSAFYRDYTGSGFTRGHLAPAADMGFDTLAMRESFYMSNISPQLRQFNNGIWRELEEQVRDWAREHGRLYIITGPVLSGDLQMRIGQNSVVVPELFYKVLLDPDNPSGPSIGFLIPNALSERPLMDHAVTLDEVERQTGLDFFPLFDDRIEEDTFNKAHWKVDPQRYRIRVKEWNHE
jgi:endonuclease G